MTTPNNPNNSDGQYGEYAEGKNSGFESGNEGYGSGGYDFSVNQDQSVENHTAHDAYYAGGYSAPQYGGFETQQESKNPVASWALGVGILSLLGSIVVFGSLLGIIGTILAIVALVVGRKRHPENRRTVMSVVGLVTSILSMIVGVIIMVAVYNIFDEVGIVDCIDQHGDDEDAIEQCINTNVENYDS